MFLRLRQPLQNCVLALSAGGFSASKAAVLELAGMLLGKYGTRGLVLALGRARECRLDPSSSTKEIRGGWPG